MTQEDRWYMVDDVRGKKKYINIVNSNESKN